MPIQVQKASRTPNRLDQNKTITQHIIIKPTNKENRERMLKTIREKKQITYKGKLIKITGDFSTETLKARRAMCEVFLALNENNFNPRILCPVKLSFKIPGVIKVFHDEQKLKQYMITKPPLQRFFKDSTQKRKANKTMKGQAVPNHRRRKGMRVYSNTDSAAHKHINNKNN
jgi:hypothetical protein